jgi:hypothetical protein
MMLHGIPYTWYCMIGYYRSCRHARYSRPVSTAGYYASSQAADIVAVDGVVAERAMDHRPLHPERAAKRYQTTLNGWTEVTLLC